MLNNIKNGCKKIQTLSIHGGQYDQKSDQSSNRFMSDLYGFDTICPLDWHDRLTKQSLSKAHPEPLKRRARGVLAVLVGALCISLCSASPVGQAVPAPTLTPAKYASLLVGDVEASCLWHIALKESNIRYNAVNRSSGAVGAWQFMNPKLKDKTPLEQVELAVKYSIHRYGTPCEAWDFWQRNYWW